MSMKLTELSITGFKTIRKLDSLEPRGMNVLIGGNGAGKSSFVSFFRFLQWMLTQPGQLQIYVANNGGASKLLFGGQAVTSSVSAHHRLRTESGVNEYGCRLSHATDDAFRFAEGKYRYSSFSMDGEADWVVLEPGVPEAELNALAEGGNTTARTIRNLIRQCVVYQFHNTAMTSRIRQRWDVVDGRFLKEDAGNLAPFLTSLCEHKP